MSSAKLINVNLLKHYHDTLVEEVIIPAVSGVVEETASKYGHSLSISGTTLSLLDYSGDTLNSITLPSTTSISWTNVTGKPSTFTPASHTHGDITNDGKLGSSSGKPLITGTDGKIATGSFGSTAGTFCEGNDSRLSDARTPTAHTHNYAGSSSAGGAATSANKINTDAGSTTTPVYFENGIPKAVTSVGVNASSASKVTNKLTVSLNGGTTEGTNKFTFDGSAAKTFDITPVGIGAVANGDSRLSDARTPTSHTHGNITNDGKLGTASRPVVTDANKNITTGSFGTSAGTFCEGNDSRLSDARPASDVYAWAKAATKPSYEANEISGVAMATHTHGNVGSDGKLSGASGSLPVMTDADGDLVEGSFGTGAGTFCEGNDSRLSNARTPTSHTHGNITNDGKLGTASKPVVTDANKNITTGSFGSTSGTFCEGNDSRLSDSRTPKSHAHGNITNGGAIGSTANLPLITGSNGVVTTGSFGTSANTFCEGNDSRLSDARTPTAHNQASSTINAMTSYSIATSSANISTSDSLNTAIGKLEYKVNNMSASGVGAASSSHTHGNITNDGKIGSTANLPLITSTSGTITTGSFGTTANTFCQGNDSRLSDARTPTDHASNKVTAMTGYSKASSVSAISTSDSLNTAIGKLEKALDGKQASGSYAASDHTHSNYLTSSSTLDASKLSGTVPSGCYTNTTYSTFVKSGSTAAAGLVPKPPTTAGTTKYLREDGSWEVPPNDNTVYTHPTTAGNKHIPSGGSTGQILVYGGSSGTASWTTPSYAASSHSHLGTEVTLTGYSKASSVSAVAATDTVNAAIGKLEKAIDGKQASGTYLTSSSTLDASKLSGTVPSGCYTNTTYSDFVGSGSSAAHGLVPKPPTTAGTTKFLREDGQWAVASADITEFTTSEIDALFA